MKKGAGRSGAPSVFWNGQGTVELMMRVNLLVDIPSNSLEGAHMRQNLTLLAAATVRHRRYDCLICSRQCARWYRRYLSTEGKGATNKDTSNMAGVRRRVRTERWPCDWRAAGHRC